MADKVIMCKLNQSADASIQKNLKTKTKVPMAGIFSFCHLFYMAVDGFVVDCVDLPKEI